jgi:outer membrane protein assembly factor BamE (lipoprotein component of BamABCDE complex)
MKYFCALILIVVAAILVFSSIDGSRVHAARARAKKVNIGDSKAQVQKVMGAPRYISNMGKVTKFVSSAPADRWIYGSTLDWQQPCSTHFPWIAPLNPRTAGPRTNDVVISFDAAEKVSGIKAPPAR